MVLPEPPDEGLILGRFRRAQLRRDPAPRDARAALDEQRFQAWGWCLDGATDDMRHPWTAEVGRRMAGDVRRLADAVDCERTSAALVALADAIEGGDREKAARARLAAGKAIEHAAMRALEESLHARWGYARAGLPVDWSAGEGMDRHVFPLLDPRHRLANADRLDAATSTAQRHAVLRELAHALEALEAGATALQAAEEALPGLLDEARLATKEARRLVDGQAAEAGLVAACRRAGGSWETVVRRLLELRYCAVDSASPGTQAGRPVVAPTPAGMEPPPTCHVPQDDARDLDGPGVRFPAIPAASGRPGEHELAVVREGPMWRVRFRGENGLVQDSKGMGYIAELVTKPHGEVPAWELAGDAEPTSDGEPVVDEEALDALRLAIEQAREGGDVDDVDRLEAERGKVTALGGRPRRTVDDGEKARKKVGAAITRAIGAVTGAGLSAAAGRLTAGLTLGRTCVYRPPATR